MGDTKEIIYLSIAIISAIAGAVLFVVRPQKKLEIELAEIKARADEKEKLSAQIQNIKDNDLHTIEGKVNKLTDHVVNNSKQITEIKTILNERLPIK